MGSINAGNDPLYVIDGTPMLSGDINGFGQGNYNEAGTNALATLNSNDIESSQLLRMLQRLLCMALVQQMV